VTLERVAAAVSVALVIVLAAALGWFVYNTPGAVYDGEARASDPLPEPGDAVLVAVEEGASARDIGRVLEREGVIQSSRLFEVVVGVTGVSASLEAGEYEFERNTPTVMVVQRIAQGRTASRQVNIREGLRAEEIGELLEREGVVTKQEFLDAQVKDLYDEPFLAEISSTSLEGYLFPATYEFARSTTAEQVVATLLRGFQDNVAGRLQLEGQEMTLEQAVTLASVVEREAATADERPIIASVFLNRIRAGIALQADPTVQYALAQDPASVEQFGWWKEGLTFDDLEFDSPYNTYVYAGLPPGPIANPGFDAIRAVVQPERTDYLFFVSRNDGTHVFAETLEEHLINVDRYQSQ
jgi:UPF0755 protein